MWSNLCYQTLLEKPFGRPRKQPSSQIVHTCSCVYVRIYVCMCLYPYPYTCVAIVSYIMSCKYGVDPKRMWSRVICIFNISWINLHVLTVWGVVSLEDCNTFNVFSCTPRPEARRNNNYMQWRQSKWRLWCLGTIKGEKMATLSNVS